MRRRVVKLGRSRVEVKGSRFTGYCLPAPDLDEATALVAKLRNEERRATHVCFALRLGDDPTAVVRSDDAGEPGGTAGRPILSAIDECDATNVVTVVARVFGGVKLGAGGLKRAYHRAALDALREAVLEVPREQMIVKVAYGQLEIVRRVVERHEGEVEPLAYGDLVELCLSVPMGGLGALKVELEPVVSGRG